MKKSRFAIASIVLTAFALTLVSCNKDNNSTNSTVAIGSTDITSVVQSKYLTDMGVSVSTINGSIVISSDGLPHNHNTPYWGVGNSMYEDFPFGHAANQNATMSAQNYFMTIPAFPAAASVNEATSLGPIGMALNGVPIFNDREGGNMPLDSQTLTTFDKAGGHPAPHKDYHYHLTGAYSTEDDANLVGFLRDGFPIYGRKDNDGVYPANLDQFGGHTGPTDEFPNGIYHYHTSNQVYLNSGYYVLKSGSYYGTKGTLAM